MAYSCCDNISPVRPFGSVTAGDIVLMWETVLRQKDFTCSDTSHALHWRYCFSWHARVCHGAGKRPAGRAR